MYSIRPAKTADIEIICLFDHPAEPNSHRRAFIERGAGTDNCFVIKTDCPIFGWNRALFRCCIGVYWLDFFYFFAIFIQSAYPNGGIRTRKSKMHSLSVRWESDSYAIFD